MLRNNLREAVKLIHHGFLLEIEAEEGVSIKSIQNHISDSLSFIEGVGKTETDYMGILDEDELKQL